MDLSPFRVKRDGRFQVWHISGGRTSGYMFHLLLEANGGVPPNAEAVFCNTGKERNETLDFLHEMEVRWSAPITWLEYVVDMTRHGNGNRLGMNDVKVVDFKSASRNGEPFEMLNQREGRIPSRTARFCTRELKSSTTDRYFSKKGLKPRHRTEIIGIRADETRRVHQALMAECRTDYPLVHSGIMEKHVLDFWSKQDFNLKMDSVFGNCDLCFLKGREKKIRILREDPSVADWWIEQEETKGHFLSKKKRAYRFDQRFTTRELKQMAIERESQPTLFGDVESKEDDDSISCFCGD